jgi:hypothetical protein
LYVNRSLSGDPSRFFGATFYLGLDGHDPDDTQDIIPLVMHELAHGLGFLSVACRTSDGGNTVGAMLGGVPDIYTSFLFDDQANSSTPRSARRCAVS